MNPDRPIAEQFPPYSKVWHRASSQPLIVIGYIEYCDGSTAVYCDDGNEHSAEMPEALSLTDPENEFEAGAASG